ncbi:MAG TPA: hypothetical protein PLI53_02350 [Geobacteraceae bacterium]|nr:hypothetical protein [Geobacteraceae bacterium]
MPVKERLFCCNFMFASILILSAAALMCTDTAHAADKKKKPPVTRYWMSIATDKSSMPGMPAGVPDFGGMFGGRGSGKQLLLQLNSPRTLPASPKATHDIPPAQEMGDTLPLLIPTQERTRQSSAATAGSVENVEKPEMRMLIYWGCGEKIRQGQPRVLDTKTMSPADFGKAMAGVGVSRQSPPSPRSGRIYADWPNRENSTPVPKESSLVGNHFVHGNYMPDIRFSITEKHDFMAPVEFTSVQGGLADAVRFQWRIIRTATGYYAMAVGHDHNSGTMIIWSSSELPEPGYALMDYLPEKEVQRLIKEKVIMPSTVNQCSIPKGIFKDAEGAMLQFIAYGDELNLVYPPYDPVKPKDPIWTMKARRKSTGMLPLMSMDETQDTRRSNRETSNEDSAPAVEKELTPGKILRNIFDF